MTEQSTDTSEFSQESTPKTLSEQQIQEIITACGFEIYLGNVYINDTKRRNRLVPTLEEFSKALNAAYTIKIQEGLKK